MSLDGVEYSILSQIKIAVSVPISTLRCGDIIKLPDEHLTKGINGKVISKKVRHGKVHSTSYIFMILLVNNDTIEIVSKDKDNDTIILIV